MFGAKIRERESSPDVNPQQTSAVALNNQPTYSWESLEWNRENLFSARLATDALERSDTMNSNHAATDPQLLHVQEKAFAYFLYETNPENGLVLDKTAPDWPASIAATG